MGFDSKYVSYGLLKIEGEKVKLYANANTYLSISVGKSVTNANWSGDELNVSMSDGKVRRYKNQNTYTTI